MSAKNIQIIFWLKSKSDWRGRGVKVLANMFTKGRHTKSFLVVEPIRGVKPPEPLRNKNQNMNRLKVREGE